MYLRLPEKLFTLILLQLFDKLGQLVWQGGFASVPVSARADYTDALRQILLHTARASHAHHVAATEPADYAHHAAHAAAHRHGVHWAAHTDDAHSDHVTGARTWHADVAQATSHANHVARLVARVHVVVQHYVARLHWHGRMGRNVVRRRLRTRRHGRLSPRRRYRPRGRLGLRAANRWRRPDRLHQLLLHGELLRVRWPHDALVRALALLLLLLELLGQDVHADAALCLRVRLHRLLNVLLLVGEHAATLPVPAAHLLLRPGTLVVRWDGWNVTAGHGQLSVQHQLLLLLLLLLLLRLLLLVPELLLQLQPW
uniref:Secreted protein n=1 Tax=Anopheles merus TaxID=30066 RepID=A0A182VA44_ANOME